MLAVLAAVALLAFEGLIVDAAWAVGPAIGDAAFWLVGPLAVAAAATLVARRIRWPLWGDRAWRWSDVGAGAVGGLVVLGIDEVWWRVEDLLLPIDSLPVQAFIDDGFTVAPVLVAVGISVATPLGEEALFRGVLHRGLRASTPGWLAVVLSSALFGLMHLEGTAASEWSLAANAAVAGAVFAWLYDRRGHLLAPVVAHAVVNGASALARVLAGGMLLLTAGSGGDIPAVELDVGACARTDVWAGGAVTADEQVACDQPHDIEVAYRGPLRPPSATSSADGRPGDRQVDESADLACLDAFDVYVGVPWEESELDVVAVLPAEERWAQGDRELVCLIVPLLERELTEPAQDGRR